jgi:hypothetical protein
LDSVVRTTAEVGDGTLAHTVGEADKLLPALGYGSDDEK